MLVVSRLVSWVFAIANKEGAQARVQTRPSRTPAPWILCP